MATPSDPIFASPALTLTSHEFVDLADQLGEEEVLEELGDVLGGGHGSQDRLVGVRVRVRVGVGVRGRFEGAGGSNQELKG